MPTAAEPRLVARFGRTERALHWVHAAGFTAMAASGLALFLPDLTAQAGGRPLLKAVHLGVAAAWVTGLLLVALTGDHRALRATRRELEAFDLEDVEWLRRRPATSGRFNAGQKSHAVAQAALAVLFVVSGALLWLGERNHAFQFPGSLALHDAATLFAGACVLGHVTLAVAWPTTRPALRGIVRGTVRADWAARHHPRWTPGPPSARGVLSPRRAAVAAMTLAVGSAAAITLARGSLADDVPAAAVPPADVSCTPCAGDRAGRVDGVGRGVVEGRAPPGPLDGAEP